MNTEKQRITIDATIAQVTGLDLPFSSCLNAMHEAEKVLDPDDYAQYEQNLRKTYPVFMGGGFHLLHATAEQRAEAFLRTIGKWEEA